MMPNPMQMISQFPQFMQQMRGQDPQQLLNQLVQSGRVKDVYKRQIQGTCKRDVDTCDYGWVTNLI